METLRLRCSNITTAVGKYAANPADTIEVDWNWNYWNIVYTLNGNGGQIVSRNSQYDLADHSNNQHAMWSGYFRKNPKLLMQGDLIPAQSTLTYQETLYDTNRGNLIVMHQSAPCVITNPQDFASPPAAQAAPPPAPTPSYTAQAPSAGGPDAVGIVSVNGKGALVQVMLGSHQEAMLIDTGATSVLVNPTLAETLVNSGEADWGAPTTTEIADGSSVSERTITIHQMRIGRHVLSNVSAWVNAKETMMLLGFPVLNQMGRFTIDTTNNLLIFG
jgi:clan AA aspartic protease (TIGR02281 family)